VKPQKIRELVTRGCELDEVVKAAQAKLGEIRAQLGELAPGKYEGANATSCTVVWPGPSLKVDEETIQNLRAKLVAADFQKLFDKVVSWKPVRSFRDVAAAVLGKKAKAVVESCEVPSSPQVKFARGKEWYETPGTRVAEDG
jgi:hypothetical protein